MDSESTEVSEVEQEKKFQAELGKDLKYSLDLHNAYISKHQCTLMSWRD